MGRPLFGDKGIETKVIIGRKYAETRLQLEELIRAGKLKGEEKPRESRQYVCYFLSHSIDGKVIVLRLKEKKDENGKILEEREYYACRDCYEMCKRPLF